MLANAIAEIVPSNIRVTVGDGMVWYATAGGATGMAIADWLADDTGPREQALMRIGSHALQRLQKFITESSDQPWPSSTSAPTAHARIEDSKLYLWLEEDGATVLECPSIEL
jgi:hypothetical protein